jgi:hypothetical protein
MRQFKIAAATIAFIGLISAAPASADHIGGGPIKQNGQCWRPSKGLGVDGTFGHWRACAEVASLRGGQARGQGPHQATGAAKVGGGGMY